MQVFYSYVASEEGAFRLVFESDLTSEPDVRERVDRVTTECASMIADVIRTDTGLPDEPSQLLAVSLVGMAQVSARFWLGGWRHHPAGRRRGPDRRPGVARHPRLPADRRPLTARPPTTQPPRAHRLRARSTTVEVKIGVQHAQRELVVDTDSTPEDVETRLTEAIAGNGVLRLSDVKGRTVIVPAEKIAYLELGSPTSSTVGFR